MQLHAGVASSGRVCSGPSQTAICGSGAPPRCHSLGKAPCWPPVVAMQANPHCSPASAQQGAAQAGSSLSLLLQSLVFVCRKFSASELVPPIWRGQHPLPQPPPHTKSCGAQEDWRPALISPQLRRSPKIRSLSAFVRSCSHIKFSRKFIPVCVFWLSYQLSVGSEVQPELHLMKRMIRYNAKRRETQKEDRRTSH